MPRKVQKTQVGITQTLKFKLHNWHLLFAKGIMEETFFSSYLSNICETSTNTKLRQWEYNKSCAHSALPGPASTRQMHVSPVCRTNWRPGQLRATCTWPSLIGRCPVYCALQLPTDNQSEISIKYSMIYSITLSQLSVDYKLFFFDENTIEYAMLVNYVGSP